MKKVREGGPCGSYGRHRGGRDMTSARRKRAGDSMRYGRVARSGREACVIRIIRSDQETRVFSKGRKSRDPRGAARKRLAATGTARALGTPARPPSCATHLCMCCRGYVCPQRCALCGMVRYAGGGGADEGLRPLDACVVCSPVAMD